MVLLIITVVCAEKGCNGNKFKVNTNDKDTQQYLNLLKKLENLKVFSTSNTKVGADMKSSVNSYLKSNPLEELMRVNNEGKNVKIYVKSGANEKIVKELPKLEALFFFC